MCLGGTKLITKVTVITMCCLPTPHSVKRKPLGHVNNQGSDDMVTPMKRRAVAAPGSEARRTSSRLASAQVRVCGQSGRKVHVRKTCLLAFVG